MNCVHISIFFLGAKHAKGQVLTYLDSHCECTVGWLEPLLDRIARDPTTVVCPVIDVIDDTTLEYHYHDSSGVNVGGFDWNLQFNWHPVPEREKKRHKNTAEPVYSPTMAGGLFSIDRVSVIFFHLFKTIFLAQYSHNDKKLNRSTEIWSDSHIGILSSLELR